MLLNNYCFVSSHLQPPAGNCYTFRPHNETAEELMVDAVTVCWGASYCTTRCHCVERRATAPHAVTVCWGENYCTTRSHCVLRGDLLHHTQSLCVERTEITVSYLCITHVVSIRMLNVFIGVRTRESNTYIVSIQFGRFGSCKISRVGKFQVTKIKWCDGIQWWVDPVVPCSSGARIQLCQDPAVPRCLDPAVPGSSGARIQFCQDLVVPGSSGARI